jgi:hypothetical protein
MDDFKLRFATCTVPGDAASCTFSNVRSGLIVGMLSIGTLFGSLIGATGVLTLSADAVSTLTVLSFTVLPIGSDERKLFKSTASL